VSTGLCRTAWFTQREYESSENFGACGLLSKNL